MTSALCDALVASLWPHGDSAPNPQVFAVIDGARHARIGPMLRATGLEHACLFAGTLAPTLQSAAPWLVRLSPRSSLTRELFEAGWSDHWCVLARVRYDVTLQQLQRHLRTILRVRDESGRHLLFRFYDPRVLRVYLPTCTQAETDAVFGPVTAFLCAAADPRQLASFVRTRGSVVAHTQSLVDAAVS